MSLAPKRVSCICAIAAIAGIANAQSLTGNVGSAGINTGEQAAEFRMGVDDEGSARSRIHYERALSDWYQLRAIASFRRDDGNTWDYSGFTLENWFQWADEKRNGAGFNGGLRLAYTFADGTARDDLAVRLTMTDRFAGDWEWRAKMIAEVETGTQRVDRAELQSRFQVTRTVPLTLFGTQSWRMGAEWFSEYGNTEDLFGFHDQAHQVGPVVKAGWRNGVYLQAGVRAAITYGSDDQMVKIFLGREFQVAQHERPTRARTRPAIPLRLASAGKGHASARLKS